MMKNIIKSVKGTRDFYPEEMAKRQWLIEKIRQTSELFGYEAYDGPCLETIELYAAKSGEELVKEQAFVFPDRSGELIALRPELTPTLARMVAAQQNALTFPLRWWSFGPFWRYERPQKGRSREFFQWNIDLIGVEGVEADAELITVAATFFRNLGLRPDQVQILVNNRKLMEAELNRIGISVEIQPALLRLIDRIDKQPAEVWDENVLMLGLLPDQLSSLKALLANKDLWQQSEELQALFKQLEALGAAAFVAYDPKIIRGLDYYTGTVFEAHDTTGEFRAILGGGHYANLVEDVGGKPLPGVGFAMGDVVIMLLLEALGLIPEQKRAGKGVLMTVFDSAHQEIAARIATRLREAGLQVILFPEADKLAKQLKYADRIGVRCALVIGPDEAAENTVVIKDLAARQQESVPMQALVERVKNLLA
jgi:histidyl-tRNA synthetase